MMEDWIECALGNFIATKGSSLNPKKFLNETFELYSIPNHSLKKPEIEKGENIGSSKQIIDDKWVLLSKINPHLNRAWVVKSNSTYRKIASSEWVKFPPTNAVDPEYLGHFLVNTKLKNYMCLHVSGVGGSLTRTSKHAISEYAFPLPPLPIQRAIVSKIEELFSSLDNGIADLKKAQAQLVVYRQAVLKKAFEGELTDSKSVEALLGDLIEKPQYGSSKKCKLNLEGIPVLRIPNIGNGVIDISVLKYAQFEMSEVSKLKLKAGDILTIRSNGSVELVGKCALITESDTHFLFAGYLIKLRPLKEKILPKYLLHCMSSHDLRVQIESKAKSTSGVNNINSGELQSLLLPLFTMNEQHQIVKEIESRLSVCEKVEESIKVSLEKAKALRQSILKQAFEGKLLTAEEIERCKQEADYEPASVLLDRIKKENNQ